MPDIYLLTGPIRSGKTSALLQWIENRSDVKGILTPVVEGLRYFMEIPSREQYAMEAGEAEKEVLEVGRFRFSKNSFDRALAYLRGAMLTGNWLLLDEIGPLELSGRGFHPILPGLFSQKQGKLILVVRDGLVEKVQSAYSLQKAVIITATTLTAII